MITLSIDARPTTVAYDGPANTVAWDGPGNTVADDGSWSGRPSASRGPRLVTVRDGLWRVVNGQGAVLGHIEREAHGDGDRFLARRQSTSARRIELGAFWRMDEAADCFR